VAASTTDPTASCSERAGSVVEAGPRCSLGAARTERRRLTDLRVALPSCRRTTAAAPPGDGSAVGEARVDFRPGRRAATLFRVCEVRQLGRRLYDVTPSAEDRRTSVEDRTRPGVWAPTPSWNPRAAPRRVAARGLRDRSRRR